MIAIDNMGLKLDAINTLLTAKLPAGRVVKRSLIHLTDQLPAELLAGIVTLVSAGESNYKNQRGMVGKEGDHAMLLIGHLKVPESNNSKDTEDAEILFIEEIKTVLRNNVAGISISLQSVEHSRQLEHPWGWFVISINVGAPRTSTY